jgi:hypothetical protein
VNTLTILKRISFIGLLGLLSTALSSLTSRAQTSGTWAGIGSMTTARYAFSAVQLTNGKVLAAGGIGTTGLLASAELYDPLTGAWSPTGNLKVARAYYVATLLRNGQVLVAGGCTESVCSAGTPTAEIYSPNTGVWRAVGTMSTLRYFFRATPLQDGNVLVEGGCNQGNCGTVTNTAELYNSRTRQWTPTGNMNLARDYHTATLLGTGKVLVTGGYTVQGASNNVEMYDPATGTWSTMASMINGRALHSATALPDGRAVIAGGVVGYLPSSLTEFYDPANNTWSVAGNLNTKRAEQQAVLLPTGQAMVVGGYSYTRPYYFELASCELFDPATNSWNVTGDMTAARDAHAMVWLRNGQVLAAGGLSDTTPILSSADIYTP